MKKQALVAVKRWILLYALASLMHSLSPIEANAAVAVESQDYLTFEYQQVGANEEEAVRLACLRAVKATVGHILFSDYALQARDLLEPYLQKNWPKFVASTYVLERRASRDGYGVRIRVQTMPEALTRDLREKRFLYLPEARPPFFVFAADLVDGEITSSGLCRKLLTGKLEERGVKIIESGVTCPDPLSDVDATPTTFEAARIGALRNGARVLVVARAQSNKVREETVLYDPMVTYETKLSLMFVRTDDGSLLAAEDVVARAADKDSNTALRDAVENAVNQAMDGFGSQIQEFWNYALREKADHIILFSDVSLDELAVLTSYLESSLGAGTRAYVRSYYGNTAVVALVSPRDFSAVDRVLEDFRAFQLRVLSRSGKRVTVACIH